MPPLLNEAQFLLRTMKYYYKIIKFITKNKQKSNFKIKIYEKRSNYDIFFISLFHGIFRIGFKNSCRIMTNLQRFNKILQITFYCNLHKLPHGLGQYRLACGKLSYHNNPQVWWQSQDIWHQRKLL